MSHRIDRRRKADRRLLIGCWVLAGLLHVFLFLVNVPAACRSVIRSSGNDIRGSVRLRVKVTGRVDVTGVVRSSGIRCADDLLERVAGDLLYHWLPSEDFPAPVELTQPMRLSVMTDR